MTSNRRNPLPCDASRRIKIFGIVFGLLCSLATSAWATVNSGEIVASSVSATVGTTINATTGVSVTFRWTTLHASNSIVVIEYPSDYSVSLNVPTRQVVSATLTTSHVVVVDHLPTASGTYGYYVASQQSTGTWATYPGPATPSCASPVLPGCGGTYNSFTINAYNAGGAPMMAIWPTGPKSVYQGDATRNPAYNDLYLSLSQNLLSGPVGNLYMLNAVVTNSAGQAVTTITPVHLCGLRGPSNQPPQGWDGDYASSGICYHANSGSWPSGVRLRVSANAVPGTYRFSATFQPKNSSNTANLGAAVSVTWSFTVLPTAAFTPHPPSTSPTLAGLATWQSNMTNPTPYSGNGGTPYRSAEWWCTNNSQTNPWPSIDNSDFLGYFDINYGYGSSYFRSFNYDGGRVYQQIADYDFNTPGMPGYQDANRQAHWKRCAQEILDPFKNNWIATQGMLAVEANMFPFGMEMNYLRTGDTSNLQALQFMNNSPAFGTSYATMFTPSGARNVAYILDTELAMEMLGQPRNTAFLPRTVDVLIGYMDQLRNLSLSDPSAQIDAHPFMYGAIMEALIDYYELDLAEGNVPDARIPLEIKKMLDWFYSNAYIASRHTLEYNYYDVPRDPTLVGGSLYEATELNDLIAPAYAWYWSLTGDTNSLNHGDDLFNHAFDSANLNNPNGYLGGGWTYSAKEFNQIYKWSVDFVNWRTKANAVSTVLPVNNPCDNGSSPCSAPWPDQVPPMQFTWWPATYSGGKPSINAMAAPTVTSSTATINFNTYTPGIAQVYYGTAAPSACSMQPYPNTGIQSCLASKYANVAAPVPGVYNTATTNSYDLIGSPNIYNYTITLTGLTSKTTYHWRPLVTDSSGNAAAYIDMTFTTQ